MFGWSSLASVFASASNRLTKPSSWNSSGDSAFSATSRPSGCCTARWTTAMPPPPRRSTISYEPSLVPVRSRWPAFSRTRRHSRCATSLSSATSTVTALLSGMPELHRRRDRLRRQRDGEVERRPVANCALDAELAAVHLHDLLNDRQPEPSPGDRLGRAAAHAAEALEDVDDLVRRDAKPGVGNGDQRITALGSAGDGHRATLWRVLHSVADEVAHDLDQPVAVSGHDRKPRVEVRLEIHHR